jgi:hypothetical protein
VPPWARSSRASPASAATDTITIVSAGGAPGHAADLTVVADSSTLITGMTAHLLNTYHTDVLDPTLTETSPPTTLASGQIQSTWAVSTPVAQGTPPAGLPLGVYQINVNVTFQDTTTTTVQNAGTLFFIDEPTLTISPANPPTVSYANPTVTISGQVTMLAPDGTVSPYQGTIMLVASWLLNEVPVTTDSNGDYTTTVSPQGTSPWVFTQLGIPATNGNANSPTVSFNVQVDPAQVTASLSAKTITYGARATVSGTVKYQPASGSAYQPAAREKVEVYSSQNPYAPAVTGATDANGNFTLTLPKTTSTTWTVDTAGSAGDPLLGPASVSLPMSVNLPTALTSFHATLNQFWQVSFSGCLGLTEPISGAYVNDTSGLTIQYSVGNQNGPWRTLSKGYQLGNGCGNHGVWFSGKATARYNYDYYRAYYPGATGFLASASHSVLAWKYADRITSFSVSPHVVANGGRLTVKGQLQYYYSKWRAFRGQQVLIILRPQGSSTWYWIVKARTNSTGHFSATFTDPVSATWSAEYEGNSTHLAAVAAMIYVRLG